MPNDYFINSTPGMTVFQAYSIDTKTDDGLPLSGKVTAYYLNNITGQNGPRHPNGTFNNYSTPASGADWSFIDSSGGYFHYSMEISSGANFNCALSFQFQ